MIAVLFIAPWIAALGAPYMAAGIRACIVSATAVAMMRLLLKAVRMPDGIKVIGAVIRLVAGKMARNAAGRDRVFLRVMVLVRQMLGIGAVARRAANQANVRVLKIVRVGESALAPARMGFAAFGTFAVCEIPCVIANGFGAFRCQRDQCNHRKAETNRQQEQ